MQPLYWNNINLFNNNCDSTWIALNLITVLYCVICTHFELYQTQKKKIFFTKFADANVTKTCLSNFLIKTSYLWFTLWPKCNVFLIVMCFAARISLNWVLLYKLISWKIWIRSRIDPGQDYFIWWHLIFRGRGWKLYFGKFPQLLSTEHQLWPSIYNENGTERTYVSSSL